MTSPLFKKSTIDRLKLAAVRGGFRVAELTAPSQSARIATEMWFRLPPRRSAPAPLGAQEFDIVSGSGRIWGYDWGSGPVVYLVHGWGGNTGDFSSLAGSLVAGGMRVVAFDAPGHGRAEDSPYGPGQAEPAHLVDALDSVIDKFGAGSIVAHSLGCLTTVLALRATPYAQRLVMVSPFIGGPRFTRVFADRLGVGQRGLAGMEKRIEERTGRKMSDYDISEPPLDLPSLILHDRGDRQTPFAHAELIASRWPNARLVDTTGLGHRRILTAPSVIGEIREFVDPNTAIES